MKEVKSCAFFGHRKIEERSKIKEKVKAFLIEKIENENFRRFYFGGFGEFDDICYEIVTELKQRYSDIKRCFCVVDEKWLNKKPKWLEKIEYEEIISFALAFEWWYKRIYFRNCAMIDQSDFVVFFVVDKENSGANKSLVYAKSKKKSLINSADIK